MVNGQASGYTGAFLINQKVNLVEYDISTKNDCFLRIVLNNQRVNHILKEADKLCRESPREKEIERG